MYPLFLLMGDSSIDPFINDFYYISEISFCIFFVETFYHIRILNSDKTLALFFISVQVFFF